MTSSLNLTAESPRTPRWPKWPELGSFRTKVRRLQDELHAKAEQEPTHRFNDLYSHICDEAVLAVAYAGARSNDGAPGIDRVTFEQIEEEGRDEWLAKLEEELSDGTYRVEAVRQTLIPKKGSETGETRPLGIPTDGNRTVQNAIRLVLEPIFEADFAESMYGYRPKKNGLDAVEATHRLLEEGCADVVDMDLKGYFNSIDHGLLIAQVSRRVADPKVLRLIKRFLRAPVAIAEQVEGKKRWRFEKNRCGTPQGGVISPLLANIFMLQLHEAWRAEGLDEKLQGHLETYADDGLLLTRGHAADARAWLQAKTEALKLTLHPTKTRTVDARAAEPINFLGYTFEPQGSTGRWTVKPSQKANKAFRWNLDALFQESTLSPPETLESLDSKLRGWMNYYSYGDVADAYRIMEDHAATLLRQYLAQRHDLPEDLRTCTSRQLLERLGLTSPSNALDHLARARRTGMEIFQKGRGSLARTVSCGPHPRSQLGLTRSVQGNAFWRMQ